MFGPISTVTSLGLAPSSISLGEPSAFVIFAFAATCSGRHPAVVNVGKQLDSV